MRIFLMAGFAAIYAPTWAAMPVGEQNALVRKYCVVCHTDAAMKGGLSLQHYDATRRDPTLAAMILSKLNNGAMGAAGNGVPDKATQRAWLDSTREQAEGAKQWFVSHEDVVVSASMVREVQPRKPGSTDLPIYRLRVACDRATGVGEMRLTWSPEPQTERTIRVLVDREATVEYKIEGKESMGSGSTVQSGRASVLLTNGEGARVGFAKQSMKIGEVFPGEAVEFPFSDLDPQARAKLAKCF